MAQAQAAQQTQTVALPKDGKARIFFYVRQGEEEQERAFAYLDGKYGEPPDDQGRDSTVRRTNEIRLDRLTEKHVIIPIVRDINKDRKVKVRVMSNIAGVPDEVAHEERRGDIKEGRPVEVAKFFVRASVEDADDSLDQNGLVNALAQACVVNNMVLACPRVERRGDGKGNHVNWLVLRLG